jgi:hypothetical protein
MTGGNHMDNATKIDYILEDLRSKVELPKAEENQPLSEEQVSIKNFLDERRIHYLVHFTDKKNIENIKSKGILSVEQLKSENVLYVSNDENRKDNEPDYISLSVSGINQYVYKTFRYSNQTIEHGVAVVIDAKMLYKEIDTPRIYCNTNAATAEANKGDSLDAFMAMFADVVEYSTLSGGNREINRNTENRNSFEPTDIQAEILWNKRVSADYILFYWDLEEDFFYGN